MSVLVINVLTTVIFIWFIFRAITDQTKRSIKLFRCTSYMVFWASCATGLQHTLLRITIKFTAAVVEACRQTWPSHYYQLTNSRKQNYFAFVRVWGKGGGRGWEELIDAQVVRNSLHFIKPEVPYCFIHISNNNKCTYKSLYNLYCLSAPTCFDHILTVFMAYILVLRVHFKMCSSPYNLCIKTT
jgi:hypothetical protein